MQIGQKSYTELVIYTKQIPGHSHEDLFQASIVPGLLEVEIQKAVEIDLGVSFSIAHLHQRSHGPEFHSVLR